jgi:hypothetical protein
MKKLVYYNEGSDLVYGLNINREWKECIQIKEIHVNNLNIYISIFVFELFQDEFEYVSAIGQL